MYRSQLKTEVPHKLNFTINMPNSVSNSFISGLIKQGKFSAVAIKILKQFILITDNWQ